MDDGRSGVVDMSGWTGHPCDKWDTEGFNRWKVDAGMACWGEDSHISPVLCAEELVEMPYEQWRSAFEPVSVLAKRFVLFMAAQAASLTSTDPATLDGMAATQNLTAAVPITAAIRSSVCANRAFSVHRAGSVK